MSAGTTVLRALGSRLGITWPASQTAQQTRLLFMGPGGTGKSYIKKALSLLLQWWGVEGGIRAHSPASANVSGV